jgi:hypothetical protein
VYQWFVFLHLVGLVLFAFAHGGSAFVALRLPGQRDRALVASYLETSQLATRTMYIGLLLLLIGGAGAASVNDFWTKPWVLGSIVVLLVVIVLMYALGTGYYMPLRRQLVGMDGAAPMTDAELAARLDERRPRLLAGIGSLGLLLIIWMMVLKPGA